MSSLHFSNRRQLCCINLFFNVINLKLLSSDVQTHTTADALMLLNVLLPVHHHHQDDRHVGHQHLLPRRVQGIYLRDTKTWKSIKSLKVLVFLDTFFASGYGLLFLGVFALDCRFILLPISNLVTRVMEVVRGEEGAWPIWRLFGDGKADISHTKMWPL
jgi:hypothetical protein